MSRTDIDVTKLNEAVREEALQVQAAVDEVRKVIVGQEALVERLLVGLLAGGHVLLEGVPGLAKTLAVKTLGQVAATSSSSASSSRPTCCPPTSSAR